MFFKTILTHFEWKNGIIKINIILMSQNQPKKYTKRMFTVAEDATIIRCISMFGTSSWSTIAAFLPNRTGRQIRERYNTYLKPGISSEPWTKEEDRILCEKVHQLGTKWKAILEFLPNRSQNGIKNRWNFHLKKMEDPENMFTAPQSPIQDKNSSQVETNETTNLLAEPLFDQMFIQNDVFITDNQCYGFGFDF